jgi:hypothetical protein
VTRPLAAALLAVALLVANASAAPTRVAHQSRTPPLIVGMGDQTAAMFADPRFLALHIHYARLSLAWDVFEHRDQTRDLATWLDAARADGVYPLISWDHSRIPGRTRRLPSAGGFGHVFRMFHARYPWVTDFATWNETNYCGEATCHEVALIAAYYRVMRQYCHHCHVLAAELLDVTNMIGWVKQLQHALGFDPHDWGLHNYLGANRLQTSSTAALLRATHGDVWFTETGGLVSRRNHSSIGFPQSAPHAALVTSFVFSRLAALSPRITRVYLYQWNGAGPQSSWDSGLIGPRGAPRPAYTAFLKSLARLHLLPRGVAP